MRFRLLGPIAVLSCMAVLAHADSVSVFKLKNQSGSGNVGTVTIDTTTGLVTALDVSLTINSVVEDFNATPFSQAYNRYIGEYVTQFDEGGDEFLFEIPALTLVNFDPTSSGKCKTQAVYCDYLANVYNGPISSSDLVETFEGNLALSSTSVTGVTPEPASIALLGTGLLGVAGVMRRRFH